MQEQETRKYDVIIVGAGPAGCACALSLKNSNLKVALFDKKSFPRDKVCGDAIPVRAINTLRNISPAYVDEFRHFDKTYRVRKTRMFYGEQSIDFSWSGESYTCARIDFDDFLFSLVKRNTSTDVFENASLFDLSIVQNEVSIMDKKSGVLYKSKIIIGADGAHSIIAKQLVNRTMDRKHYVGSVRAYYSGIDSFDDDTTDVYVNKTQFPGYLWVFPLPGNKANVGFGMLSSEITKRKVNIKTAFHDFITQTPELAVRFKNATLVGDLEGFGLPLGSKRVQISGDNFMLVGDAASLIDPVSGDGVGNGMLSGKLAAEQVARCFKQQNFSGGFISSYDKTLFKKIGTELRLRYRVQQIVSHMPVLIDIFFWLTKSKTLKRLFQKAA